MPRARGLLDVEVRQRVAVGGLALAGEAAADREERAVEAGGRVLAGDAVALVGRARAGGTGRQRGVVRRAGRREPGRMVAPGELRVAPRDAARAADARQEVPHGQPLAALDAVVQGEARAAPRPHLERRPGLFSWCHGRPPSIGTDPRRASNGATLARRTHTPLTAAAGTARRRVSHL